MKNIMKAQLFQLKREKLIYILFGLCVLLLMITVINSVSDYETFGELAADMGSVMPQFAAMILIAVVSISCGKDFMDQTGNYEILSGHTRKEVYFGHVIPGIICGVLGTLICCLLVVGVGVLFFEWGDAVSLGGYLLRVLLLVFPFFRIACEIAFLTFVVRNAYIIFALGYVYVLGGVELLAMVADRLDSYYLGFTNMVRLMSFSSFQTYSTSNPGIRYTIYDASLSSSEVGMTIGVSVIISAVFLMLGYHFFKCDDIR